MERVSFPSISAISFKPAVGLCADTNAGATSFEIEEHRLGSGRRRDAAGSVSNFRT